MFLEKSFSFFTLFIYYAREKNFRFFLHFRKKMITFAKSLQQAAASAQKGKAERREKKKGFYRPPLDLTPPAVQFDGGRRLI